MENLGQFLQEKEALLFGQSVNSLDTTEQFTELKSDIAHMKADIAATKVEITSNCEATKRFEQKSEKYTKPFPTMT